MTAYIVLHIVGLMQGFILGFYICYSGWVIGGKDSTFNIMAKWGWVKKLNAWVRSKL